MAEHGLEGIDRTVQLTYTWIDEIAARFHGDRHHGFRILRAYLHTLRDHLSIDESAQLAAQLPMLIRGIYFEGWDPSRDLSKERSAETFVERFNAEAQLRAMDIDDALAAAAGVVRRHVSGGEMAQVFQSLPRHVRDLLEPVIRR